MHVLELTIMVCEVKKGEGGGVENLTLCNGPSEIRRQFAIVCTLMGHKMFEIGI